MKLEKVDLKVKNEILCRRKRSAEFVDLFDEFMNSDEDVMLVVDDKKYSTPAGLSSTLNHSANHYGYTGLKVIFRNGKTYLVKTQKIDK